MFSNMTLMFVEKQTHLNIIILAIWSYFFLMYPWMMFWKSNVSYLFNILTVPGVSEFAASFKNVSKESNYKLK